MTCPTHKSKHICNSHKPTHKPKIAKELALPKQEKIVFKKFSTLQKNKKRNAQPDTERQKSKRTMTLKLNTDNGLKGRTDRTPAANRRLAQWRVKWLIEHSTSHQLLWCIDSFVLRNPPLRQAPKRCV